MRHHLELRSTEKSKNNNKQDHTLKDRLQNNSLTIKNVFQRDLIIAFCYSFPFFGWFWGLNSVPLAYEVDTLSLEPDPQPFLTLGKRKGKGKRA
jgi:hypothetical protein